MRFRYSIDTGIMCTVSGDLTHVLQLIKQDPAFDNLDDRYAGMKSPAITAKINKEAVNLPKTGKGPIYWGYGDEDRVTITFK